MAQNGSQHRWTVEAVRLGHRLATQQILSQQSRQMDHATATKFFEVIHGMPPWAANLAANEYALVWTDKEATKMNPRRELPGGPLVYIERYEDKWRAYFTDGSFTGLQTGPEDENEYESTYDVLVDRLLHKWPNAAIVRKDERSYWEPHKEFSHGVIAEAEMPPYIEVKVPGEGTVYSGRDDIRAMTVYGHYIHRGQEVIVYVNGQEWERYVPDPEEELEVVKMTASLKRLSRHDNKNPRTAKQIRIVLKKVGQPATITIIDSSLEAMQAIVGGLIQIVPFGDKKNIELVFNEEGRMLNLPPNVLHSYWGPLFGNLFVMKRGAWKPGEAEAIMHTLNAMPKNLTMNPTSAGASWPIYEYKFVKANRPTTVQVPGHAPYVVQAGEFIIFKSEQQPGQSADIRPVGVVSSQGILGPTRPEAAARDLARTQSKKLDARNPNPVRVLDPTGRCVAAFLRGNEASCETAAAEDGPRITERQKRSVPCPECGRPAGKPCASSRIPSPSSFGGGWGGPPDLEHAHPARRAEFLAKHRALPTKIPGVHENPVSVGAGLFIVGVSIATGIGLYYLMQPKAPPPSPEIHL